MKNNRINPNESNDDDQQRILRRLGIQLRRTSAISCNLFFGIFNAAVVTRNFHLVHCHHRAAYWSRKLKIEKGLDKDMRHKMAKLKP